ncbi:MAG TPA: response regulator [Verrucomicrobiae bacterium]|nr:response regulator [Verrucomicrobiae bacterium]
MPCDFRHLSDGGAAIQALEEAQNRGERLPDFIFLDLKMPVLSGFEVLAWLGSRAILDSSTVVVLSGSNQESDKIRALNLGAAGYLVKPISPSNLAEWLQRERDPQAQ